VSNAAAAGYLAVRPRPPLVIFKQRQDGAALVSHATYGVSLTTEDPTAELPRERHGVWRDL